MTTWPNWFANTLSTYATPEAYYLDSASYSSPMFGELVRVAPPPARLLELGCGLGCSGAALRARGYRVVAIDQDSTIINHARQMPWSKGMHLLRASDETVLRWQERRRSRFDIVTCLGIVEHMERSERLALLDTLRRLAPVQMVSIPSRWLNTMRREMDERDLTLSQLVGECRSVGWQIRSKFGWGDPPQLLRLKKALPWGIWRLLQCRGWCSLSLLVIGKQEAAGLGVTPHTE